MNDLYISNPTIKEKEVKHNENNLSKWRVKTLTIIQHVNMKVISLDIDPYDA